MKRVVAIVLLLCALWPALSHAEGPPAEELNRGVRSSDACAYSLMSEARLNTPEADALIEKALVCAPDLPSVYFALSRAYFYPSAPALFKSIDYLVQGVNAYARNFWWSLSLATSVFFSVLLSFMAATVIVVAVRLFMDVPLLKHDISEMRRLTAILPVLVLCAFTGPLVLIACMLVLLALYMKKTDRILLYAYLVFLLLSPLLLRTASVLVDAYSSGNLRAIVQANGFKGNEYALSVLDGQDSYDALFTYALVKKRQGHYEEAIALYEKLLKKGSDARVYVNLGNCYIGLYNFDESRRKYLDKAEDYYKMALDIEPLAAAYYNMSQVARERLDFTKGNEYYKSALALDRNSVALYSMESARTPNRFVADEPLPSSDYLDYIRQRHETTSTFGLTSLPVTFMPFFALLFFGGFYVLNTLLGERAYRCRKCSAVLCWKCEKSLAWGQMCPQCYASLIKLDESDVKERVSRLLVIYDHGRKRRNMLKLLSLTLPGLSQIFAGRILSGFALLWAFLFFVSTPLTEFIFSPGDLSGYHFFSWLAVVMAAGLWGVAQFITRERISRGWL